MEVLSLNTVVTSKDAILKTCRHLIKTDGWEAINMRNVANNCNISIGSIYNYFANKNELIMETVESIWCDIFHMLEDMRDFTSFVGCIEWLFASMEKGNQQYPGFFDHHSSTFVGENKIGATELMQESWQHIKDGFLYVLKNDSKVNYQVFDEEFSINQFIEVVFSYLLSAMLQNHFDSRPIVRMIELSIYR